MIATAYIAGLENRQHSLCCAKDAIDACGQIVGGPFAQALRTWTYEHLGCSGAHDEDDEQYYLDEIAELALGDELEEG